MVHFKKFKNVSSATADQIFLYLIECWMHFENLERPWSWKNFKPTFFTHVFVIMNLYSFFSSSHNTKEDDCIFI